MLVQEAKLKKFILDSGLVSRTEITTAEKEAEKAGGAMGLGDVKLIMLMAGLLGWPKLFLAFMIAAGAGVIVGFPKLWRKWVSKREDESGVIPFGPFLSFGTLAAMLASAPMFEAVMWYLDLIGGR